MTQDMNRGVTNTMALRDVGDWYLYCGHCTGRIFLEFNGRAYWVQENEDGTQFLAEVEPYRPSPKQHRQGEHRSWWVKLFGLAGKPEAG